MKCYASLENTSKVTDPNAKRNRVKSAEERKHPCTRSIQKAKRERGIFPKHELEKMKQKLTDIKRREDKVKNKLDKNFVRDVWEEDHVKPELKNEWFEPELVKYTMRNVGKPVVHTPIVSHVKRSRLQ